MEHLRIRLHRELSSIQEKYMGFSVRQWISLILAAVITVPAYFFFLPSTGSELASWIVLILGAPILLWGFVRVQGLTFFPFLKVLLRQYLEFSDPINENDQPESASKSKKKRRKKARRQNAQQQKKKCHQKKSGPARRRKITEKQPKQPGFPKQDFTRNPAQAVRTFSSIAGNNPEHPEKVFTSELAQKEKNGPLTSAGKPDQIQKPEEIYEKAAEVQGIKEPETGSQERKDTCKERPKYRTDKLENYSRSEMFGFQKVTHKTDEKYRRRTGNQNKGQYITDLSQSRLSRIISCQNRSDKSEKRVGLVSPVVSSQKEDLNTFIEYGMKEDPNTQASERLTEAAESSQAERKLLKTQKDKNLQSVQARLHKLIAIQKGGSSHDQ